MILVRIKLLIRRYVDRSGVLFRSTNIDDRNRQWRRIKIPLIAQYRWPSSKRHKGSLAEEGQTARMVGFGFTCGARRDAFVMHIHTFVRSLLFSHARDDNSHPVPL